MTARALMFQGTGSDVGKSLIVAGLCRALTLRGYKVRPFKPQNMSNNAAVTADGGEIGRAQALQARACGVEPSVHMNPVLLKPQSETGAQVVVQGQVWGVAKAREYQRMKHDFLPRVLESFAKLQAEADIVLVEGAGSPAEINLREDDIANMGFARATGTPVVLIGDIDRGGVIAQIVGTRAVLDPADAAMIRGFLVNKFRGDPTLFADGMGRIEALSGWPSFGLVPHFPDAAKLPAEDAVALERGARRAPRMGEGQYSVVAPRLPHIANFDDLDPLRAEPGLYVEIANRGAPLPEADVILLPGSKSTIADLKALRAQGWDIDILAHVRRGGKVIGLCGGYQMLGTSISDLDGIEGPPETVAGLGLLDVATVLGKRKRLARCAGRTLADKVRFEGYEIHMGRTEGPEKSLLAFDDGRADGAISKDGRVRGCYVHGLFGNDEQRRAWLNWIGADTSALDYEASIEAALDRLAAHLESCVDVETLLRLPVDFSAPPPL